MKRIIRKSVFYCKRDHFFLSASDPLDPGKKVPGSALLFSPLHQISLHGVGILPISVVLRLDLTDLELESLGV